ncbi:hypothetical protein PPERSA_04105 [Pseudocohnilembus persalinus]|uniref:Uncharacterized protein n=1 Tax=Pseudocohnilembus persalinus TaxID=266149 RepID=A0A0V0QL02_PSEPJ|nr:hypothetical protein PPERSA_04105 [Pseudocohnilembus persalinus]|eukprot:KRX02902.1 hypothetical protein PPERSA_04105 [Pseudocohnilembus persalinus]
MIQKYMFQLELQNIIQNIILNQLIQKIQKIHHHNFQKYQKFFNFLLIQNGYYFKIFNYTIIAFFFKFFQIQIYISVSLKKINIFQHFYCILRLLLKYQKVVQNSNIFLQYQSK